MNRTSRKTNATTMNKRIEIQSKSLRCDVEGGQYETWATVNTVWASVWPVKSDLVYEYKSMGVEVTHQIKIRGYIDVTEQNRIIYDGRTFEILTVENFQENDFDVLITCKEEK